MNSIELRNVHKRYANGIEALKGISFDVPLESFTAFLGKNGAGKSTTINMISTLIKPTQGTIHVGSYELGREDAKIRQSIGTVFQQGVLDAHLSVFENLLIRGSLYNLSSALIQKRIDGLVDALSIQDLLKRRYGDLSGGQKRKVDIARAMINLPKILILDEPTTGLDPKSRQELWQFIHRLKDMHKMTILLTTHYLDEVLDADRIVIIHEGRLIENDTSHALRQKYTQSRLIFQTTEDVLNPKQIFGDEISTTPNGYERSFKDSMDALKFLNQHQAHIKAFEVIKGSMDDVFLRLTESEVHDDVDTLD